MDRAGHQLLACASFAQDQHRPVASSDFGGHVQDMLQPVRLPTSSYDFSGGCNLVALGLFCIPG